MNQLTKYLISEILDGQKVTAVYGGGFKPPTKGHFDLVKKALDDNKEIDKFIIYVGGGVRDGITQEQSMQIWQLYKEILGNKVEIVPSKNPIGDVKRYPKNNPKEKVYFVIGAREGREDDLADVAQRTAGVEEKYPNTEVKLVMTPGGEMSGTNARKALKSGNKEKFFTFLPDKIPATEKENIWDLLNDALVKENDPKVGTGKKPKGSGRRLYTDEDPTDTVAIKFSSKQDIIDTLSKTSFKSKPHNRQSQIINVIHQRVRAAYQRAKDPEVKARLKKALEYAEQRKEASKEKTQRLKKLKEGEGGADTSWTGIDNETITLQDILELTKDIKIQNFPTKELASIVLNWDNNPEEIERISQVEVSSQYPVLIMVDEQGKIQWILDGNHRAQKALRAQAKTIPTKLIKPSNLNSKARKILLGIVDERLRKENVAPNHTGKAAPFGSGYKEVNEIGVKLSNYSGQVLAGDVVRAPKGFPLGGKKLEKSLELKVKKISREGVNRYKLSLEDSDGKNYTVRNYQMDGEYKGEKLPKWGLVRKSKENVNENTIPSIDIVQKCAELTQHMIDKGYNIQPLPSVKFISDDTSNAEDFLGRTAYYNPGKKMIVLYTYGRHPKDIVRSFAHEMIHHMQNLEGRIGNGDIKTTNTNEDDYLKKIEAEANLKGTMTFRNWTDNLRKTT